MSTNFNTDSYNFDTPINPLEVDTSLGFEEEAVTASDDFTDVDFDQIDDEFTEDNGNYEENNPTQPEDTSDIVDEDEVEDITKITGLEDLQEELGYCFQ